jgi:flagellar hook-basal body complex protein FliE
MPDPLGLIGQQHIAGPGGLGGAKPAQGTRGPDAAADGPSFMDTLREQIQEVNALQKDAKEATEDLMAGRREDVEGVMIATQKADTAFRMLLQVRNKVLDAYEEIKQVRI